MSEGDGREDQLVQIREQLRHAPEPFHAQLDDPVQLGELGQADRQLRFRHPVVEPHRNHADLGGIDEAKRLLLPDLLRKLEVVAGDGPPLPERRHVLIALEAVAARFAGSADRLVPVSCAGRVRRVVYHLKVVPPGYRLELFDGQGSPAKWTPITARVCDVTLSATALGSRHSVTGSMSANTTLAPAPMRRLRCRRT